MTGGEKILIAILWERTSAAGNTYLSGFLGKARVVGFRGEPTADGVPTWDLYLTPGKEQAAAASTSTAPRQRRSSPRPKGDTPAGDGTPFNDSIDDVGRA
jgi:hypothetical protein